MKYLVDTNILLRLVQKNSPIHLDTQRAILKLKKQGEFLCIIPQNIIEFWAVATRPLDKNGLGLSITQAEEESEKLKKIFILELDTPQIFTEWESLVIKYQVMGKQVHDARLAAAMVAHNITHLLTFNVDDFKRFSDIVVVDPRSIV
ncbi:type II toxin-antitoxin system VapC family toxin [Dolichospermum sp. LEGE 00240]|jgi:predicted nucleic acid-binding protein|uniref:type II toxin-antitoxin system VapC family toxin n=1 Tax=Dolichospermum sp. LEGE 00240 TaxID=1828603 RepID=UPI00187EDC84|nr:type II toxin-antitoxin system VapC family toxin [Dolichospermum sp. LEGE 00240]MBE9249421.1 type II toxin-antitoxin system VapC family toxin [Dolichospermum sp. LEGE 00240]MDM3855552.1 type II toxin-antitoxin system VapC family toxin [Aphanizomenon gracile PMC649.10]MDM3861197.1 type II toxin-antitoxin system VapC family toxin [Aphanizomenon gracile PMC644.10]